ncbi:hypothetical protein QIW49_03475 [Francisellaceae bacterium CB300]
MSLVKRQRCAWGFLILSCLLKITTMQDFSNINIGYFHYYIPELVMILIAMIGYISYSADHTKNTFKKISSLKKIILFVISLTISLVVYYLLIHIVTKVSFSVAPVAFSLHLLEYIFIIFALSLAIFKSPLVFASIFIAFIAAILIQVSLLIAIPHYLYLHEFCFNSIYIITLMVIALVSYKRNRYLS